MAGEDPNAGQQGSDEPAKPMSDQGTYTQKFSHQPVAARVPEKIARGVFCTGVVIQDGPNEFVLDFLQAMGRPHQIVARVVIAPPTMAALCGSVRDSLNHYIRTYGAPPPLPKPNPNIRPSIQELYDNFKLPEELYSGTYAGSFMIGHGPAEFMLDFVTGFFPTASVSCRAYFAAGQMPRVLDTLTTSLLQHQRRFGGPGLPPPAAEQPPAPPAPPQG